MKARVLATLLTFSLAGAASAQAPALQSPGMSSYSTLGQTTRFSNEFNPALGFVIDTYGDWLDSDDDDDGFDAEVRLIELNGSAFVDPDAWAYIVITSEDLEELRVEEAAVAYIGFEGNTTLTAGRVFIDFGKQMQEHLEELRTLERPLVLREYLGEELAGTGAQVDYWFAAGDETPVRFSVGVFASLLGESHGHEDEPEPESFAPDRKDFDDLSFSARLTGMTDVGESGVFQLGASARFVPEFTFEFDDLDKDDQSNTVYGVDVTYGWQDEIGEKGFLAGGEWLLIDGDLSAEVDDPNAPSTLDVVDDTANGFLAFADWTWSRHMSGGVQYSWAESVEDPDNDDSELDLYLTRHFTEFRRLRLGVTLADSDEFDDSTRVYLQFTNFFGTHAHGINW